MKPEAEVGLWAAMDSHEDASIKRAGDPEEHFATDLANSEGATARKT